MKDLFRSARYLAEDLTSTFVFLGLMLTTHNPSLSIAIGMGVGAAQLAWRFARRQPIDQMQWMSLLLVLGSGAASLLSRDPRFVMVKPSVIYVIVGIAMLKPGWMNRYLPPKATKYVPDLGLIFGFVWAGLMFVSAALNLILALTLPPLSWSASMSGYAVISKVALFLIQYAIMRVVGVRRWRRGQPVTVTAA